MLKTQYYGFEVKDIIKQFVSAFNSIVIDRYNKDRDVENQIQVNFLYSPKERVLHDSVNKQQHVKLPVIAVSITGISRDTSRNINKINGFYESKASSVSAGAYSSNYFPSPIPIKINVNMDILARFQSDLDQIISNFVPYNNPYITISWKIPDNQGLESDYELRNTVFWDGNISYEYPNDINNYMPYRVSASTSFTINGWLFKNNETPSVANIFTIDSTFIAVSGFDYE